MKLYLTAASLLIAATAIAQPRIEVKKIERVPLPEGVKVESAVLSPDGKFIVADTGSSLERFDIKNGQRTELAKAQSPYCVTFSADGSRVAWLDSDYEGRFRFVSAYTAPTDASEAPETVVEHSRTMSTGLSVGSERVRAIETGAVRSRAVKATGKQRKAPAAEAPFASTNYGHLDITYPDGTTVTLDPQGPGSYLWPVVSPDGSKVAYWLVGEGCYVANIDGSNPQFIGILRDAHWLGNDMLVGMHDIDDGVTIISSRILASDLHGNMKALTPDDMIAMDPSVSADGKRITFSNVTDASVYLITVKR